MPCARAPRSSSTTGRGCRHGAPERPAGCRRRRAASRPASTCCAGRPGHAPAARVETDNDFPTGAGLASSASGFAALVTAGAAALGSEAAAGRARGGGAHRVRFGAAVAVRRLRAAAQPARWRGVLRALARAGGVAAEGRHRHHLVDAEGGQLPGRHGAEPRHLAFLRRVGPRPRRRSRGRHGPRPAAGFRRRWPNSPSTTA